ncbi:MAG: DMT family transporter [Calditrichaeota bacterium]|nr:DMT family transporter [Calditrichota bacterium]
MTIGYLLAVLTGICFGIQGVYAKWISRDIPAIFLAWITFAFTVPFLGILVISSGIPEIQWQPFLLATLTSFCVNVIAWYLFFRALQLSPIYLTMPFTALTPLFLIPVSFLLLGEFPNVQGGLGVGCIILGAYGLHLRSGDLVEPIRALFREKGTRLMMIVALIWSISATVEKVAVLNSSPVFYGLVIHLLLAVAYLPLIVWRHGERLRALQRDWKKFSGMGLISAAVVVFQFTALQYLLVSYVIAFKRAGILISVLLGYVVFREAGVLRNLVFSALMVAGATLIMLS